MVFLTFNLNHDHESSANIDKQIVDNSLKWKALDQGSKTQPLKSVHGEVQSNAVDLALNHVHSIRRSDYRARRKTLPPLSKNIKEVHTDFNHLDTNTYKGKTCVVDKWFSFECSMFF